MKKLDLERPFQMLANVAVIVGIAFLGIEMRQNNELLDFQKSLSSLQVMLSVTAPNIENPDMRRAMEQAMTGNDLSPSDTQMLRGGLSRVILTMQWQYKEVPQDRESIRRNLSAILDGLPLAQQLWIDLKDDLDPEFVTFFEAQRQTE